MLSTCIERLKRLTVVAGLMAVAACSGDGGGAVAGPAVRGVNLDSSPSGVFLNSSVAVTFSAAMDPATLSAASFGLATGGTTVAGTVAAEGTTAVFTPAAPLAASTVYTVTLSSQARSVSGRPLVPFRKNFSTGTASDTVPPAVVATTPGAGATGVVGNTITITFTKSMNPSTLTPGTVTLTGPNGAVGITGAPGDRTFSFDPVSPLRASTTYSVIITTGARDLASNPLSLPVGISFTTAGFSSASPPPVSSSPPRVVSVSPDVSAINAVVSTPVIVTFNEEVDPATVTPASFTVIGPAGPVAGTVTATGRTAIFTPVVSLASATQYTVSVTSAIRSPGGLALSPPFTWSFTTAGASPTVIATVPAAGATGVATTVVPAVTFSSGVDPATVTTETFILSGPAGPVRGAVVLNGSTATFTPLAPLAPATSYTATVTSGVRDPAGVPLAPLFSWTFTTGTGTDTIPPTVVSTTPATGATGVSLTSPGITATFSRQMDPATVTPITLSVAFSGLAIPGTVSLSGTAATFTPLAQLQRNTIYTAIITTGARDSAGNPLAAPFSWTFTTGGS